MKSPWLWLVAQAVLVLGFLAVSSTTGVLRGFDAKTYEETLLPSSLSAKLQSMRTLGYPLFLAAVKSVNPDPVAVAITQLGLFVLATLAFARGFELFSGSAWLGLAAATPLLYCPLLVVYSAAILADVLAAAFALAALGGFWWVLARPSSPIAWTTLAAFLVLAYQTRPSYLFLLVLVPLAGGLITWRRLGAGRALGRILVGLLAASLLPFLAWCSLRWFTTGHFGLVSFGGVNLVGITASMLSPELVSELEPQHRALAESIVNGRKQRGLATTGELRFKRWGREYNKNVWRIATRSALRFCRHPGQSDTAAWVEANRCLSQLSQAVIRHRPGLYLRWVTSAFGHSLLEIARHRTVWGTGLLLALALVVRFFRPQGRPTDPPPPRHSLAGLDLALTAGLFLAGSLGLMVLVEAPIDRYLYAAMLLLPSAFTTLAVELMLDYRLRLGS